MAYTEDLSYLYPERPVSTPMQPQHTEVARHQTTMTYYPNHYQHQHSHPAYMVEDEEEKEVSDIAVGLVIIGALITICNFALWLF